MKYLVMFLCHVRLSNVAWPAAAAKRQPPRAAQRKAKVKHGPVSCTSLGVMVFVDEMISAMRAASCEPRVVAVIPHTRLTQLKLNVRRISYRQLAARGSDNTSTRGLVFLYSYLCMHFQLLETNAHATQLYLKLWPCCARAGGAAASRQEG